MVDHLGYIPILRPQASEFDALRQIKDSDRQLMTPLINVLPSSLKSDVDVATSLKGLAAKVVKSWCGSPILIDLQQIASGCSDTTEHPVVTLWQEIRQLDLPLCPSLKTTYIPVIGITQDSQYETATQFVMEQEKAGLCLRVTGEEVSQPTFWSEINSFLIRMKCLAEDVHLLIDFQLINKDSMPNITELCAKLPFLTQWRTLTVAAGSFPPNLTQFKAVNEYEHPRLEWRMWREQVAADLTLPRRPSFGDYGIYHPFYIPPAEFPSVSASIRYTSFDYWVIMRGRAIKLAGAQQYPAHAASLYERDEFCGADYSAGDAYIANMHDAYWANPGKVERPGNPKTWLQAGFNHHITQTARAVASLSAEIPNNVTVFSEPSKTTKGTSEQYKVLPQV